MHASARLANRIQRVHQRMGGADLVVAERSDQKQVVHIGMGRELLQEIERSRIQPLQVVEKEHQWMFFAREDRDELPEHSLEALLRLQRREVGNRRLFSDNELEVGDEIDHERAVWAQCLLKGGSPSIELRLRLSQHRAYDALKGLRQSGIRNVALVLIKFTGSEQTPAWNQSFVQFVHDRGLADAGVSVHQREFGGAARQHAVERTEQGVDLSRPTIQLLRDQQTVR